MYVHTCVANESINTSSEKYLSFMAVEPNTSAEGTAVQL